MSYAANNIQIKTLESISSHASDRVMNAIETASDKSGVDFSYLVQQASAESSFNPDAKAKTSSATGLFQFIDSTWLSMLDRYGDEYGIETDGKSKAELLNMRKDPKAASFMAAAFASENERFLNSHWGGDVGSTELYFTHFMGASGGASFLNARDENPLRPAADLFPRAARANRNVFYDQDSGRAKTMGEVYQFFDKKFQVKGDEGEIDVAANPTQEIVTSSLYKAIHYGQSDSIVMQKSQAMRDMAARGIYGQNAGLGAIAGRDINNSLFTKANNIGLLNNEKGSDRSSPFFSLITMPVDIMIMTQTLPSKVVRDNV